LLKSKTTLVNWHPRNKKWYESKGYTFTKWKDEFEVKVDDLLDGSTSLINVECDDCSKLIINMEWRVYKKCVRDNIYYCRECATKLFAREKIKLTKLSTSKSFYDWCYDNLPKEEADKIMLRWDYEKNIDKNENKISPKDVSYGSVGFDKKGYWFKCLDHPEHESEQKCINNYTAKEDRNINCDQCNTIALTHPELVRYLTNKEDAHKYSLGSNKLILAKCPECGYEKEMLINTLFIQGFSCNRCSDHIPYPEKFVLNILEQLNIIYKPQLSKTTFKWCNKFRYDFYIHYIKCIVETHGLQHYENPTGKHWRSLKETQENDKQKEFLAKQNDIENYVIIDCRKSTMEWIKNSVMNSELPKLLNFKESDIDWLKCHEYAVKATCELWRDGNSILKIANELKISRSTVSRYLKQGIELGWRD